MKQLEFRAYDKKLEKHTDEGEFVFNCYGNCELEFHPNSLEYAHDSYHKEPKAIRNARFKIECRINGGVWFDVKSGVS